MTDVKHKKYLVDVTFRYVHTHSDFGDDFETAKEHVEFYLNGSSSCALNIINDLARLDEACGVCPCVSIQKAEVIREATANDIEEFGDVWGDGYPVERRPYPPKEQDD